jgi:hypothetical protein
VCKDWLAAISDPQFVDTHLQAAKQRPSVLMVPTSYNKFRFRLLMGVRGSTGTASTVKRSS